eukprot:CAMPEP_0170479322 /NCGR_PEP_ID=MMETSP0208-20121228/605_1 /TAXON_ID=197538 /ORGANISM="Strombidium inclinatum, Strain S3" /LENGTH=92 /DNA_ID=CAMNT_0010751693 /DNA_START=151 /DNA_END=429 /DNA_ORIENTATION=+
MTTADMRRERYHHLSSYFQHVHDACFMKCADSNNLNYLSIDEGVCFRNCITKVGYFMPTMPYNMEGSGFQSVEEEIRGAKESAHHPTGHEDL